MKKGIYFHSDEIKRKLSELAKKRIGEKNPFYGRHHSKETKQYLKEIQSGIKSFNYGKYPSEETRKKMSKVQSGRRNPNYNKHPSQQTRQKMSEARRKEKHHNWKGGKIKAFCELCNKEKYVLISRTKKDQNIFCSYRCASIYRIIHQKKHDTNIERLIEDELIKRNILYTKQVSLLNITVVDFLLPNDIVIYADGSYWHSLPGRKTKDLNSNFMLTFYGYKVFRFTDKEIMKSAKKCIDKIYQQIRKKR